MKSWIMLHRKIREWGWYSDPITKSVFIELLLIANWKKTQWNGIDLEVGDAVIGRKVLAQRLGISEQNVRTALKHLESTDEITKKHVGKFTVVHINSFAFYQNHQEDTKATTTFRSNFGQREKTAYGRSEDGFFYGLDDDLEDRFK